MHTLETEQERELGLGGHLAELTEHLSRWWRLEVELALIEVKYGLKKLIAGIVLILGAVVMTLFSFGFALAAAAAAIGASGVWDGLLIVAGALFLCAAGFGVAGVSSLQKARLAPAQALAEAARTKEALRGR